MKNALTDTDTPERGIYSAVLRGFTAAFILLGIAIIASFFAGFVTSLLCRAFTSGWKLL